MNGYNWGQIKLTNQLEMVKIGSEAWMCFFLKRPAYGRHGLLGFVEVDIKNYRLG